MYNPYKIHFSTITTILKSIFGPIKVPYWKNKFA